MSNFMASQDTRLSKFEADFKQQQGEMTNKIDTIMKAINDRMTGTLPSDMVKNPELNVKSTSLVLSTRSYPMKDPQFLPHSLNLINAIKPCARPTRNLPKDQLQMINKIGTSKPREPEKSLKDEFKDLHLNLPVLNLGDSKPFDTLADLGSCVNLISLYIFKKLKIGLLEETDHVFGLLDITKSYLVGIVKNVEVQIGRQKLLDDFYVIDIDKDLTTLLLVGRGFLATANAVIDYRNAKIAVAEGVTSLDGIGARPPYYAKKDFTDYHLPVEWEITRDAKLNPFKDVLVFRRMVEFLGVIPINLKGNIWESEDLIENKIDWNKPPKGGDGAWNAKIRLIDLDEEEFTKTFQSIPTTRKLFEKENPSEFSDLDHFHDS
ncbi:MAK10-like protein [Tanacetum coccineum]